MGTVQTQLEQCGPLPRPQRSPSTKLSVEARDMSWRCGNQEKLLESMFRVGVGVQAEAPSAWDQDQKAHPEQDARLTVYSGNCRRAKDASGVTIKGGGSVLGMR